MAWDLSRRQLVRAVNSKYIYGRIPLVHTLVLLVEMALVARLTARFNAQYDERPLVTMMITNTILGGIADTVAQTIAAIRFRRASVKLGSVKEDDYAIEIHELGHDKHARFGDDALPRAMAPPPFDFERLARFMAYGFAVAPLQFKWFRLLERVFPMTKTSSMGPALKRMAMDQAIYAPFGLGLFFTVMTVAEGGGRRAVSHKLRDMFLPTLQVNYLVWPAVQLVNFRLMPMQFQLPFVSTVGIAWTAYLSLTNASD
ncbi:hypothetical protein CDD82_7895 [Ophiocordyceps australis]|uniref:Uncharacterized protein n=1 Tax=Ophiocordyceps australis TaxID=1399860 RepID=A0A2C5YKH1_9HYPO|nr:hypothetical protein CDD82_7895 [Ophiocordyceps australis]